MRELRQLIAFVIFAVAAMAFFQSGLYEDLAGRAGKKAGSTVVETIEDNAPTTTTSAPG